jgi:hypothetical protein
VRDVVVAYWEGVAAREEMEILQASTTSARQQLAAVQAGIEVGKLPRSASAEVIVAVALREDEAIAAEEAQTARAIELARLLGLELDPRRAVLALAEHAEDLPPLPTAQTTLAQALEHNPQLAAARTNAKGATIEVDVADNGLLPALDLSLSAATQGNAAAANTAFRQLSRGRSYELQASLTFQTALGRHAAKGALGVARGQLHRAQLTEADITAQIRAAVLRHLTTLDAASRRLRALADATDAATLDLAAEKARFEAGRRHQLRCLAPPGRVDPGPPARPARAHQLPGSRRRARRPHRRDRRPARGPTPLSPTARVRSWDALSQDRSPGTPPPPLPCRHAPNFRRSHPGTPFADTRTKETTVDIAREPLSRGKARSRTVIAAAVVVGLAGTTLALGRVRSAAPSLERASVYIDTVKRGALVRDIQATGTLVPEEVHWLSAIAPARVERILVHPGATVAADTILLELTNPELELTALEAERQLASVQSDLTNLEATLDGFASRSSRRWPPCAPSWPMPAVAPPPTKRWRKRASSPSSSAARPGTARPRWRDGSSSRKSAWRCWRAPTALRSPPPASRSRDSARWPMRAAARSTRSKCAPACPGCCSSWPCRRGNPWSRARRWPRSRAPIG